MKNKVSREIRAIERRKNLALERGLKTAGLGLLSKIIIAVAGFSIGTPFYSKEGVLHIKIDSIASNLGNISLIIFMAVAMIFAVRFFKLRSQFNILQSIQQKR